MKSKAVTSFSLSTNALEAQSQSPDVAIALAARSNAR
jgi:hypothetical protein